MSKVLYKDYKKLFNKGEKKHTRYYVAYYIRYPEFHIKTAVKKRIGNAVKRNYEKRVIKNILKNTKFKGNFLIFVILIAPCLQTFENKKKYIHTLLADIIQY
ncbi:MAG TPA: ribonuclease P protein component [Spirochaetota bacterium]|nr:ribonuclease P protein component [Spirochaetota bacterium]